MTGQHRKPGLESCLTTLLSRGGYNNGDKSCQKRKFVFLRGSFLVEALQKKGMHIPSKTRKPNLVKQDSIKLFYENVR